MVDRKKEIFLTKKNDVLDKVYVRDVRKSVAKKHKPVDEIAILRKMLYCVAHGEAPSDKLIKEFDEYYNEVEKIKTDVKEELGI